MKYIETYKLFELKYTKGAKKSKRKLGWFTKHCINLGYKGAKNGRCYGTKVKNPEHLEYDKDYYYDVKESTEVSDDIKSDINDIFIHLKDVAKVGIKRSIVREDNSLIITMNLDHLASPNSIKSKYGVEYRPTTHNLSDEIIEAIGRLSDIATIDNIEVHWINAGEWYLRYPERKGTGNFGPGTLSKQFKKDGIIGPLENTIKGCYTLDILPDFIEEKGDRVRMIKIYINI